MSIKVFEAAHFLASMIICALARTFAVLPLPRSVYGHLNISGCLLDVAREHFACFIGA